MSDSKRHRLHVESLEAREVPASPLIETFDSVAPPALPTGWGKWSNDASNIFTTVAAQGAAGSVALVSTGGSRSSGLAWSGESVPGDTGAAVSVRVDSLVPTFVFARGSDLGTGAPSYLAAVVTRGLKVELWEVTGGTSRVLASVGSPGASYLSGQWVRLSLVPTGSSVAVQVTRADTGQYLNANGGWQTAAATALAATTTLAPATGFIGVGRIGAYSGTVRMDDFETIPAAPTSPAVNESFDTTAAGAAPTGWKTWSAGTPGTLGAATGAALSPAHGFASTGGSSTAARAWATAELPADVDASAAVYLNGLIPGRVFVRGSNLDTATPTYYAASVVRGVSVQLVRVVNGVETTLGAMNSTAYVSGQWVRLRIIAEGDRLRVSVLRTDTTQWLGADGTWSDTPDFALEVRDPAITAAGKAGVARPALYSGTLAFDDFNAHAAAANTGPVVTVTPLSSGNTFTGDVTFKATATGAPIRVEFRLKNVVRAVSATSPATWTLDTTTLTNGTYTLTVRAFDPAGNIGTADYTFTTSNADSGPIFTPTIPKHYSHIRIAQLAYGGNPMGTFEQNLLKTSVDLVIPNTQFLARIQANSPNTPQLIYSNVSNLYQGLLTDWLAHADRNGVSREVAFYHVTKATAFSGASSSSQPVNWFWGVYQTLPGGTATDQTSAARGGRNYNVGFGGTGTTTAIGYTDKFREMNVTLASGAAAGWSGVWEYATAVDATGKPTAWKALTLVRDGTNGLKQSGQVTFDPPADWVAASIGGSDRLMSVRVRTTAGDASLQPVLKTVFGRDYVNANGALTGTIPAFDYAADRNQDGYLDDTEYAGRKAGMNARFVYESRLFYPYYGQMRFVTNPSDSAVRKWAADYHTRLLAANPLADGLFMDNAQGKLPFVGTPVLEPTGSYGTDSGALVAAVSRAIEPDWVLANTAGGGFNATPVSAGAAGSFEEFILRPMQANWSEVGDVANLVAERLSAGSHYLVLDSHPAGGSPLDPRTQVATLAYYYLVGDPDRTFLMFNGGYNPSSSWTEHWSAAATVDIGTPTGAMKVFATGTDPANAALTYQVLARDYTGGMVLYKPLSYATGLPEGTTANTTATTVQLGGNYRVVNSNGTLGSVVSSVTLRNGEGAVLVRA